MKYAVVEIGGKQIIIEEGKYYLVNRLPQKSGSTLLLNRILFCNDHGRRILGHPYIKSDEYVRIIATILEHCNGNKISVFKMKPKKKMTKTVGHRQALTRILIDKMDTN